MLRSEAGKDFFLKLMHLLQIMLFLVHISPAILDTVCIAVLGLLLFPVQTSVDNLSAPLMKHWHKESSYLAKHFLRFALLQSRNSLACPHFSSHSKAIKQKAYYLVH